MNEFEYQRLAASCDALLRAPSTDRARLAIGCLHLIHEHPSWLSQYLRLYVPDATPARERPMMRGARDLLRVARGLHHAVRWPPGSATSTPSPGELDVLIVSHLANDEQLARSEDFYFGSLPEMLRARGAKVLVALADHRHGAAHSSPAEPRSGRVLLPRSLSPHAELELWRQCTEARSRLARDAAAAHGDADVQLARMAAEQALAAGTAANLRLYAHVRDLCSLTRPRLVLTTFEGDACERMIFLAARQSGAACVCVGFQHTRLLPRAHAIRRAIELPALPCDPDVILTLGPETQALLESPGRGRTRFIVYGSHRRTASEVPPSPSDRAPVCLFLPDAEPGEYAFMLDFAVSCAHHSPGITFLLRPHPVSGVALRRARKFAPRNLPPNMRVDGEDSLQAQAASSRCCVYRASSAVFHAVLAGARPLYLARPNEMSFDPLAAMSRGRATVSRPGELATLVAETGWHQSAAALAAWHYCDRYVSRVRPAALDELLDLRRMFQPAAIAS